MAETRSKPSLTFLPNFAGKVLSRYSGEQQISVDEGIGHSDKADVVRLVGRSIEYLL